MLDASTALVVRYHLWCVCVFAERERERERLSFICVCMRARARVCVCTYIHTYIVLQVRTSPGARSRTPCPTSAKLAIHTARSRVHRSTSARNSQESPAHYTDWQLTNED